MKNQAKHQSLSELEERIAYVVTDLNGLRSIIVNEEVSVSDFNNDLTELFEQLNEVEEVVKKLSDLF